MTAVLIEDHRSLGSGPGLAGWKPLRDPDQDVPHGVAVAEDQHLVRHGCRVLLGAHGVGVHGERLESGGFPVEGDGSGDGRRRRQRRPATPTPQPAQPPATTSSLSRACSAPSSSTTSSLVSQSLPRIPDAPLRRLYPGASHALHRLASGRRSESAMADGADALRPQTFSKASDSASLGSRSGTSACRRISQPAAATKHPPTAMNAATSRTDGRIPSGWSVGMTCQ